MSDRQQGDNGMDRLNIGDLFEVGDLMMLIETIDFAVTRSMFSSSEDRKSASARFQYLAEKLSALSPLPKGNRSMGYEWFEIMKKAQDCDFYLAYMVTEDGGYGGAKYHLEIVCDETVRRVVSEGDEAAIQASIKTVMQYLREQAKVTAEPLVMLNGLVEMDEKIEVRRKDSAPWKNVGRLDEVSAAMRRQLEPASPFVYVVEAASSWVVDTMVEARFAVPLSSFGRVASLIEELNAPAKTQYEMKYTKRDFSVSPSP